MENTGRVQNPGRVENTGRVQEAGPAQNTGRGENTGRDTSEPGVLTALTDLNFERTATPGIAKFLYVVGILIIALAYVGTVAALFSRGFGLGVAGVVAGAVAGVFALLLLRVGLEYVVAVVRLAEDARRRR